MYCGAMPLSALNIRSILWEIRCLTGNQWRFPGGEGGSNIKRAGMLVGKFQLSL